MELFNGYKLQKKKLMRKLKLRWGKHSRVKCDCGHYPKDHYLREGCCTAKVQWGKRKATCGCTWYYPNVNYILRKKKEKQLAS